MADKLTTYKDSEIVIGLVAPVGVNLDQVQTLISEHLIQFGYTENIIRLSDCIKELKKSGLIKQKIRETKPVDRYNTLMTAGNEARETLGDPILAMQGIYEIYKKRENYSKTSILKSEDKKKDDEDQNTEHSDNLPPLKKYAHVIRSFKHPKEVMLLRRIYSHGFILLGISSSYSNRLKYLTETQGIKQDDAVALMERDEFEKEDFGQHTRKVFHLSDGFIDIDAPDAREQFGRIFELFFGNPYITPSTDEFVMFLAFASALRSGDLSRQVGAVIMSEQGEIISTGCNEAPKFGGGLYWPDDDNICRDIEKQFDSNEKRKKDLIIKIMNTVRGKMLSEIEEKYKSDKKNKALLDGIIKKLKREMRKEIESDTSNKGEKWLKETGLLDITEYGRSVHAEMEALLSCARSGVSPRNGTLYTTTFPCHNCAKHIVASGVKRVVFVEPYPKSHALDLHDDSLALVYDGDKNSDIKKVKFQPFVGLGARRYIDLFSMNFSTGYELNRKNQGKTISWTRQNANLRVQLLPFNYIEREAFTVREMNKKRLEKKGSSIS